MKIAKNVLFLAYFSNNLTNHALLFCAFGQKHKFLDILRKFSKIFKKFLKKIAKNGNDFCLFLNKI